MFFVVPLSTSVAGNKWFILFFLRLSDEKQIADCPIPVSVSRYVRASSRHPIRSSPCSSKCTHDMLNLHAHVCAAPPGPYPLVKALSIQSVALWPAPVVTVHPRGDAGLADALLAAKREASLEELVAVLPTALQIVGRSYPEVLRNATVYSASLSAQIVRKPRFGCISSQLCHSHDYRLCAHHNSAQAGQSPFNASPARENGVVGRHESGLGSAP